jgi:hypothetical protein
VYDVIEDDWELTKLEAGRDLEDQMEDEMNYYFLKYYL